MKPSFIRLVMTGSICTCLLAGCATPVSHTDSSLSTYDKNTKFGIEDRPNGFSITIYYSRYQLYPKVMQLL